MESKKIYEYAKKKRVLQNKDMQRYGIEVIEISEFLDIPQILKKIANQVNKENVFISAAVAESKRGDMNSELVRELVNACLNISDESKVVSGYGLNVGPIVIDSTMQYLETNEDRKFDEKVRIYPFAIGQSSNWTAYRKLLLSDVGVCILLYGTKESDGKVINSTGMFEEFSIAKDNGSLIIPVGSTGGMSSEISLQLIKEDYHREDLQYLQNETDIPKIVERIVAMINHNKDDVEGE